MDNPAAEQLTRKTIMSIEAVEKANLVAEYILQAALHGEKHLHRACVGGSRDQLHLSWHNPQGQYGDPP
jgi:hypothetical protein